MPLHQQQHQLGCADSNHVTCLPSSASSIQRTAARSSSRLPDSICQVRCRRQGGHACRTGDIRCCQGTTAAAALLQERPKQLLSLDLGLLMPAVQGLLDLEQQQQQQHKQWQSGYAEQLNHFIQI